MAISFLQFAIGNNGSGGTASATFTNPIAAGSIIAVATVADNGATFSFSDGKGDTATDCGQGAMNNGPVGTTVRVVAFLSATAGAQTVTVTTSGTFCEVAIWEIAGLTSAIFDKAVFTNNLGTSTPTSGSTGTLSSSNEAAIGYGVGNGNFTAAGSGWTGDSVPTSFGNVTEHQIVSSNAAIAATAAFTQIGPDSQMVCATFMSGSTPPATTIGWSRAVDADRRGLIALQSDARQAFVPRFTTAKTPAGIVWPTGSDKERLPPIPRQPDERYFTPRVLQAVNTNAGIPWVRPADEARIILRQDQYAVTWSPPQPPITTFFASSNADDYNPLAVLRRGDYAPGWTPKVPGGQASTISGMAWNVFKEEMRPPKPPLNPDEFRPWFVRSPNPVPITWLPLTGKDAERLPPLDRFSDRYAVTWPPNVPPPRVAISGMAWNVFKEEMRPPPSYEDRRVSFTLKPPLPPVGISGMAWFIPPEQIPRQYPGNTNQGWSTVWNPFIPPASPVVKVTVQYHPFFANMGQLRGFLSCSALRPNGVVRTVPL